MTLHSDDFGQDLPKKMVHLGKSFYNLLIYKQKKIKKNLQNVWPCHRKAVILQRNQKG